jgi:IS1 family transposase
MLMHSSILVTMNTLKTEKRIAVVRCLVEGNSVRSTVRITGVAKNTVVKLLVDLGNACSRFHDETVHHIKSKRVQCDEIWSLVGCKQANVELEDQGKLGRGDVWTWTAIDADTKLMIYYQIGMRDADNAYDFMNAVAERLANRVQLTTDGLAVYLNAVQFAFTGKVDYVQLVKHYGTSIEGEKRYSPAVCTGCDQRPIIGNPDVAHISTSFVERQNLTMRMGMRRFTRLTNAFSKKIENHFAAIALHFMHYNFCRKHQTLKTTPAVAAGIADHVWTVEELVALLDAAPVKKSS